MRAGLRKCGNTPVTRFDDGIERLFRREVDDVNRHLG